MRGDRASGPEAKPWRLFVAADVPDAVRSALDGGLARLRSGHPELRWLPSENWHVTLKFLGAVWPPLVDDARSSIASVAAATESIETRLDGVDAFPTARRARVVWIGLADVEGRFVELAARLDRALARIAEPEDRPFTAHLTVARAKRPVRIEPEVAGAIDLPTAPFAVDRIVLYRSRLRRPAPLYEPLESFAFRGREGR